MLVSVADKPCVAIEPLKYSSSESRNRGTASCPRMNIYRNSEENVFVVVLKTQRQMSLASHGASPIVTEKEAKQLLRSRRQDRDRPSKPGFPDEPMRDEGQVLAWETHQPRATALTISCCSPEAPYAPANQNFSLLSNEAALCLVPGPSVCGLSILSQVTPRACCPH
ncbi:uncharacterized protein C17orf67 homolog isoform X1 [Artibeus jamaicensis]|uniref:uncharacterized protein C17orf67 homolog isoform X1 n=1 Tax=Artibeus jamaicensis TaxID=9417 RepID=UPI00235AA65D|nr:uncharacterized protein C17orf67 homolog isoform X1 [Artibeus jamaicensis]XP_053511938.1 uncharacterized protein C17orf67 homolog isoform X1 [Artibeus jamaicensis]XP_053511941.1 uncharacterized protein C17orf67 homolog isoform X1 [Artibeus jamaicensis]